MIQGVLNGKNKVIAEEKKRSKSITLSGEAYDTLEALADMQNISFNEAVRRAIATESCIREELAEGSKILVQKRNKAVHQLVFK